MGGNSLTHLTPQNPDNFGILSAHLELENPINLDKTKWPRKFLNFQVLDPRSFELLALGVFCEQ